MDQRPETLVIGTAGHIDHGKSALVRALTGVDPDRLKEEQARGITIDLGFAHLTRGERTVAFIDVPGHERFVKNMLAGAGGIDAVLFVVAADESIKPQTREHFDICRLLGIERGLIALTKIDTVGDDLRELVELEVREFVAGSFLAEAPILPVSAKTGAGLEHLAAALVDLVGVRPRQARDGVVRLPVDRVFSVKGFGTVVTGTLVSGRVAEGADVVLLPAGEPVRVRGVEVHGLQASEAVAPRRVAVNLGAVDAASIRRGVTVASPGSLAVTRHVDVRLTLVPSARPLEHGAPIRMHQGTGEVVGRVLIGATRAGAGDWMAVRPGEAGVTVLPGGDAYVRLRLRRPAVLTRGDRLVIRSFSPPMTIAGGVVLDPEPRPGGIRRPGAFERFRGLDEAGDVVDVWLAEQAGRGLAAADMVRRGGLGPVAASLALEQAVAAGTARPAGGRVFEARFVDVLAASIEGVIGEFHQRHPIETGMPRDAVRQQTAEEVRQELFDTIVGELIERGRLAGTARLRLSSHRSAAAGVMATAVEAVLDTLAAGGLEPPDVLTLAASVGVPPGELRALLQLLVREDRVVRLDTLFLHPAVLARLKDEVRLLAAGAGQEVDLDVAAFKNRYGLTRKYAIPLLEWLDRQRVTRREGNRRVILPG
jgi:selenocysteine-specific elongation factor